MIRPLARNGEVETKRVVLRAVGLTGGVEGDNLVAEDVISGLDALGDLDEPSEVVLDEYVGGPEIGCSVNDGLATDVEEFELGLVYILLGEDGVLV